MTMESIETSEREAVDPAPGAAKAIELLDALEAQACEIERHDIEYSVRGLLLLDTERERDQLRAELAAIKAQNSVPQAWTNLLAYVLQDDMHNRLTPRVVDIAYTAFTLGKRPNAEDGGASDWFNDTKPKVAEMIEKLRKDLIEEMTAAPVAPAQPVNAGLVEALAMQLAREAGAIVGIGIAPVFYSHHQLHVFAKAIYKLGRNAGLEEAAQLGRIGDRVKNSTVVEFVGEIYELKDNTP